jgi:hypothetical protein
MRTSTYGNGATPPSGPRTVPIGRDEPRWMRKDDLAAMGYSAGGVEVDYGMRWGVDKNIRVSYAPYADPERDGGFLYAYEPGSDRYALLRPDTTPEQVDAVWTLTMTRSPISRASYVELAGLIADEGQVSTTQAQRTLAQCIDREMAARTAFAELDDAAPDSLDGARQWFLSSQARSAAEALLIDALNVAGGPSTAPFVITYRIGEQSSWTTGRLAAQDWDSLMAAVSELYEIAERHHVAAYAESLSRGRHTVKVEYGRPHVQPRAADAHSTAVSL